MMPVFAEAGITVLGHDPMVTDEVIRAVRRRAGQPRQGVHRGRRRCSIINDHPDYRAIQPDAVLSGAKPLFIYDSWRILDELAVTSRWRALRRPRLPAHGRGTGVRALLLGGAGFIGLHLARRLVADGHEVTIVDDFSRGRDDFEASRRSVRIRAVTVIAGDLTAPETWAGLPHGWDQIYLLAAVVGVRNVERDPARVIRVNTLAALHLLDWATPGDTDLLRLDQRGVRRRRRRGPGARADR